MKLNIISGDPTVTVITPTIASPKLVDAVRSVNKQNYPKVKHYVVCDGYQYHMPAHEILDEAGLTGLPDFQSTTLYENVGANGFYGHRIYAAFSHLVNSDYVLFLDEDNWYEPDHIESMVETVSKGNSFAYSFRNIYSDDKNFICQDNCESLGMWPIYLTNGPDAAKHQFLIDTSSFIFKRDFLIQCAHMWHSGWGGDRRFFYAVKDQVKWDCNYRYSLNYRLDGNSGSVNDQFFLEGNRKQAEFYKDGFPWQKLTTSTSPKTSS